MSSPSSGTDWCIGANSRRSVRMLASAWALIEIHWTYWALVAPSCNCCTYCQAWSENCHSCIEVGFLAGAWPRRASGTSPRPADGVAADGLVEVVGHILFMVLSWMRTCMSVVITSTPFAGKAAASVFGTPPCGRPRGSHLAWALLRSDRPPEDTAPAERRPMRTRTPPVPRLENLGVGPGSRAIRALDPPRQLCLGEVGPIPAGTRTWPSHRAVRGVRLRPTRGPIRR